MNKAVERKAKEWAKKVSVMNCADPCEGCSLLNEPWGCEQRNIENGYLKGYHDALDQMEGILAAVDNGRQRIQMQIAKIILLEGECGE